MLIDNDKLEVNDYAGFSFFTLNVYLEENGIFYFGLLNGFVDMF